MNTSPKSSKAEPAATETPAAAEAVAAEVAALRADAGDVEDGGGGGE